MIRVTENFDAENSGQIFNTLPPSQIVRIKERRVFEACCLIVSTEKCLNYNILFLSSKLDKPGKTNKKLKKKKTRKKNCMNFFTFNALIEQKLINF